MNTETYTFGAERDRLDDRLDDIADQLANADAGTQGANRLRREGVTVESQLKALEWACDEYGADAEVTVQALDAGEMARVRDKAAEIRSELGTDAGLPGARRNIYAAMALVDAPFLSENAETVDDKVGAVQDGHPDGLVDWIQSRAEDLNAVGDEDFRGFDERLKERRTSDTTNS